MRKLGSIAWALLCLAACSSEEPRTQITLMIDAEPRVKAEIDSVRVAFSSGPLGSDTEDLVARTPQDFAAPFSWPLVLVLVPADDNANRSFQIAVSGRDGTSTVVEASARSHFLKGKHLALRMRLIDACRNAVFAGCDDGETCLVDTGGAHCADDTIDPSALPAFDGVDSSSDAGFDAQVSTPREIVGRVFTTDGLLPLAGATTSLASGASVTTNSDGEFSLTGSNDDRVLTIEHPDHALAIKPLPSAASVYLEVFVKEVDVRQTLSGVTGGAVQSPNGAAAVFPASAFKRPNGDPENGMAEVTLASPDTKDGAQAQAFPGDFKAVAAGKEGAFAAAAAIDVTATSGGMKLNLSDDVEAEISLPVKSPGSAQTLDLWSFDPVQRAWGKEGTATLTQDATGKPIYRAKISHLSWWAVGTLVEDTACMHLCATYNSTAAAFARATVTGIDAPFQGSFFADDSGCVAFDVAPSTQISLVVQSIDGVSEPRVVITPSTLGSSDDVSTCQDLGTIALMDRNQSSSGCPSTWSVCNGTCTDLSASPAHCGSCTGTGAVCAVGELCVNGTCGCANNETQCGSQCVDTNSNAAHCGTCDRPCGASQRCNNGACVDISCTPPTTNCSGICVDLARDGVAGQCPNTTLPDCLVPAHCPTGAMCSDNGRCVPTATCAGDNECPSAYRCNVSTMLCEVASGTCTPISCQEVGADCDNIADGCGGLLNCGTCMAASGETCGGGGVPNVCGIASVCGDGARTGTESCDDGDRIDNNACDNMCRPSDICGGGDSDGDSAVDEAVNFNVEPNCGACGVVCSLANATSTCSAGSCVVGTCAPNFADCDGMPSTGCETLLLTQQHCGSCGNACGPGQACQGGSCVGIACGDAIREGSEQCDDGNVTPLDGCNQFCLFEVADRCDNIDNDSDSAIDEGPWGFNCSLIPFGTVVGECTNGIATCTDGIYACSGAVGPLPELCDGLDNDCDGLIDDNVVDVGNPCGNTVGACDYGVRQCVGGAPVCVGNIGPASESCDSTDNDCDGFVDETIVGCNP